MAYTTNEKVAEVRAKAVNMVRGGKSTREVARYFGYGQSTIVKWYQRAPKGMIKKLETQSPAPKHSPNSLPEETVGRIIHAKIKSKRCAEVVRNSMTHRHIHPRSPNENGHLERFNRTIQEEIGKFGWCIFIQRDIQAFLKYYNTERMHMGINFKTPIQLVRK